MVLFNFAKKAGEKMAEALSDGGISDIFKKNKLDDKGVEVKTEGEKVILNGKVKTQEEAEKIIIAAGNNEGVAEVESNIEVEEPAPEAKMYEVQSGDSLSRIAKEFYGDAMKYPVIFEANKPMLTDPDKIYPGQMLRIPPLD
jgi:nucleoid-associated protein YgaU